MRGLHILKLALAGGASAAALAGPVSAKEFDVPRGDLANALEAYIRQAGVQIVYSDDAVRGHRSPGAHGDYTEFAALTQILSGTGFAAQPMSSSTIGIVRAPQPRRVEDVQVAAAAPRAPVPGAVETVVVTAQHKSENIQNVPISITALSQAQLTDRQIAGGPDLLHDVPNMDFTKTNFSGYDIELRGIGTQAISVTTDPAVAVAFNDMPFIRNHFFEQEFFDLQDVEVLLGPQGTLYGRNATAGVVNLKSALPTDEYEAMMSADLGNYSNRRLEGMLNIPIVGDTLDVRFAGEWTKRNGYSIDTDDNTPIDGRDLWSGRMTIGWKPASNLQTYFVWEHFSEDDDRLRSGKQVCETSNPPAQLSGSYQKFNYDVTVPPQSTVSQGNLSAMNGSFLSQGCQATSLYAPSAFEVPDGTSLPYVQGLGVFGALGPGNPYAETTQSTNLRQIQSQLLPTYKAKNDTLEFNATYRMNSSLTLTSQTGYNQDFLWSTEDYDRFDTSRGVFNASTLYSQFPTYFMPDPAAGTDGITPTASIFCDPQLGCSDRLIVEDLDEEHAWQFSQEFRLASSFSGPFNFSFGANYLHYETQENYYVFSNALTAFAVGAGFGGGVSPITINNSGCLRNSGGYQSYNPIWGGGEPTQMDCIYIDTNPIGSLNNKGHNYFLSQNPYALNSYAGFGETYYNITPDLKLTTGLRWTVDQKHFVDIPSDVVTEGYGYLATGFVNQEWDRLTGRSVLDWSPQLDFTDQTLFYASYAHGYKAGGANPPGASLLSFGNGSVPFVDHPLTFKPEYIEAFELGTKNTLLDDTLTLNGDIFYYNYTGYQISEIVDRTAINNNYNAHVDGAELTANWEPLPGLKFNFAGGWEDTAAAGGDSGIDLMDRTAGTPGWLVVKPYPTQASNCILPAYVVAAFFEQKQMYGNDEGATACGEAYDQHLDPVTGLAYTPNPVTGVFSTLPPPPNYPGFNPLSAPNGGEGFAKNLAGHALPNAPPFTVSFGGEYSMPVSEDWVATLRSDYYWQDASWARIFNDNPYDKLGAYTDVNVALILTSANGWQVMGYVKNVFNVTAITGDFLNSDDSGLTTNVFLTDPRLWGVRVTKQLDQSDGFWGADYNGADFFTGLFSNTDGGKPTLWIEWGGQAEHITGQGAVFAPGFLAANPTSTMLYEGTSPTEAQQQPFFDYGEEGKVSYQPDGSDWTITASARFGRSSTFKEINHQTNRSLPVGYFMSNGAPTPTQPLDPRNQFADTIVHRSESHSIMDFEIGKDVGLGAFGFNIQSILSAGVRFAQFVSSESVDMRARPELHTKYVPFTSLGEFGRFRSFHTYHATGSSTRKFHGVGPTISWTGTTPIFGESSPGGISFDWGANGAVLFGRQETRVQHHESGHYVKSLFPLVGGYYTAYNHPVGGHTSNKSVAVPNIGGFAGLSYRYNNAKISFGYRADVFFGAIDGGIDHHHSETLNMGGPFATISFGLGG